MHSPKTRLVGRLVPSILLLCAAAFGAPETDPLDAGSKPAAEWIKVRLETARIESEWAADRPLLESTISGLKARAQTLEEQRDTSNARSAKDREEIDSMQAKNKAASDDLTEANDRIKRLAANLIAMRASFPPRLSAALELPYRSLANPSLGDSERMQISMTILGRCEAFNRTITSGDEVLTIDGGEGMRSLEVIYWGLSHGYALDRSAAKAWYGSPGPGGWHWEPSPGALGAVERLIAIYKDKADPEFIVIPAVLLQPSSETQRR